MKLFIIGKAADAPKPVAAKWGYDCTYAMLVRAKDEQAARLVAHDNSSGDQGADVWLDSAATDCQEVTAKGQPAVLMTDFLAG